MEISSALSTPPKLEVTVLEAAPLLFLGLLNEPTGLPHSARWRKHFLRLLASIADVPSFHLGNHFWVLPASHLALGTLRACGKVSLVPGTPGACGQ